MCFKLFNVLDELFGLNKNKPSNNTFSDDDFDFHCESCGELLEDCECDFQDLSAEDISEFNLNFDDEFEIDDEPDASDDGDDFDDFDSF